MSILVTENPWVLSVCSQPLTLQEREDGDEGSDDADDENPGRLWKQLRELKVPKPRKKKRSRDPELTDEETERVASEAPEE